MNTQEQNTINTLRINLEELEKRIKSLEKQLTSTQLATSLSACLSEIKEALNDIETEYNTVATSYQGHLADFTAHISNYTNLSSQLSTLQSTNNSSHQTMQAGISSNTQTISSISGQLQTLQASIGSLTSRVQELETNGVSGGGSGDGGGSSQGGETTPSYEIKSPSIMTYEDTFKSATFNNKIRSANLNKYYSQKLTFVSDLSQYIKILLKVNCTTTNTDETITPNISLKINYDTVHTENFPAYVNKSFTIDIKKNVLLKQKVNYFQFCIEATPDFIINDFELTVQGINVKILSNDYPINIICALDKYFVCDRRNPAKLRYGVIEKADFNDLSSLSTLSELDHTLITENMCNIKYSPVFDTNFSSYSLYNSYAKDGKILVYTKNIQDPNLTISEINPDLSEPIHEKITCTENTMLNYDFLPTDFNGTGYVACYITSSNEAKYCAKRSSLRISNFTYNGANIINAINIFAVKLSESMLIYHASVPAKGFLIQDTDGVITYYPAKDSTYKIEIGTGYDFTAYHQKTSNKINIYVNNGCFVTKHTLSYDTANSCYVKDDATTIIPGILRYEELYNNKALVYKMNEIEIWNNQTF